jgi:hypothetical protein
VSIRRRHGHVDSALTMVKLDIAALEKAYRS